MEKSQIACRLSTVGIIPFGFIARINPFSTASGRSLKPNP
ncbi:hypothetical protein CEV31_1063 [Brucella thiophenivorans]|uniref:Uncharacterized protein n=1 Tax=Brucella thiophenivorans TaxID=571255 RepID=A0A256FXS8_9HYPH|nr:hypothetical protein CEV31_1063 [Brucella thiophenivorans]